MVHVLTYFSLMSLIDLDLHGFHWSEHGCSYFNRIFFMQTVHTLIKCNFIEHASMGVHQGHQRVCDKFQHEHFKFQGHLPAQQHITSNINYTCRRWIFNRFKLLKIIQYSIQ